MYRRFYFGMSCGVISALLACSSTAHADLLGYWSANSPSSDFSLKNDQGNADLDGELFGGVEYTADGTGVTGLAGDYALEFFGVDEDYAAVPFSEDVTFDEITLTAWLNGEQTGDWSGIFQSRGSTPIGIGYGGGTGNVTYTWNNNNGQTYNFGGAQPQLNIPPNEWTFVALSLTPDEATLFVGPQGEVLDSATNAIPHIAQLPVTEWRMGEDDCCGTERNFLGLMDDVAIWNHALRPDELAQIHSGEKLPTDFLEPSGDPRPLQGNLLLAGSKENTVFGPAGELGPGLGQSWYAVANPGNKAGVDAIAADNDPAVPYFQAESGITWWSGSDTVSDVPNYPAEVNGVITGDNYTVKLAGEILIEESGFYRFLDGVDDYTYLAIDTDRSGVAGDSADEVLIDDNTWTNALSNANGGAPIVEVDIENVAQGGEWLAMEFNMAEGGGGDSGMLYWDYDPEGGGVAGHELFPLDQGEGVFDEDAIIFLVPDTHLRGPVTPPEVLSGDISAVPPSSSTGWEVDVIAADGTAEAFVVENPDANVYTTIMNVDGLDLYINALGEVSEGDSFQVIIADSIVGSLNVATEGWNFDPATGFVTFGMAITGILGDIDGDGTVGFPDFLILSAGFGNAADPPGSAGDIDGDGTVGFPDFLILSANFGQSAAAAPQSVPEPSGLAILSIAAVALGFVRRRRG